MAKLADIDRASKGIREKIGSLLKRLQNIRRKKDSIDLQTFQKVMAILENGLRLRILNQAQHDFLLELFQILEWDMNKDNNFSGFMKYIYSNRDTGIFDNIKNVHGIDIISWLVEEINPPPWIDIVKPFKDERTISLDQTITFAAQIKNLKITIRGYRYGWMVFNHLKKRYYTLEAGRTNLNLVFSRIPANHKYLGIGTHDIEFGLYNVFSKKERRQTVLPSPHLIGQTIQINIIPERNSARTYQSREEIFEAIDSLSTELNSLADKANNLIINFPKSEPQLIDDVNSLKRFIEDLDETRNLFYLYGSSIKKRIENESDRPLFRFIGEQLDSGKEFHEIVVMIINNLSENRDRISSNVKKIESVYNRRQFLKRGALGVGGLATTVIGGSLLAEKYDLLKKLGIRQEDLPEELTKIKIKIINPKENSVLGIGDYLRNFEAIAEGPNKKLVKSINDGKIGRFEWWITKEDNHVKLLNVGREGQKSHSRIPDFGEHSGQLMAVLWVFNDKHLPKEQPHDIINIIFIKINIGLKIEENILSVWITINDDSGKNAIYEVTPHIKTKLNGESHWDKKLAEPNKPLSYIIELVDESGKDLVPGEYYFFIYVKPNDSNQAPVVSDISKIKIEKPLTMTDEEYYSIKDNVEYYVMPKGRLGDLASIKLNVCADILSLLNLKRYYAANKKMREGSTQEKICGVNMVLEFIRMGNEDFKKGNITGSKQLYRAAKKVAIYVNEFNSLSVKNSVAIFLLLPVLNQPLKEDVREQIKNSELVKPGSIYRPLFSSENYSVSINKIEIITKKEDPNMTYKKAIRLKYSLTDEKNDGKKEYDQLISLRDSAGYNKQYSMGNRIVATVTSNPWYVLLELDDKLKGRYILRISVKPSGTNLPLVSDEKEFEIK